MNNHHKTSYGLANKNSTVTRSKNGQRNRKGENAKIANLSVESSQLAQYRQVDIEKEWMAFMQKINPDA